MAGSSLSSPLQRRVQQFGIAWLGAHQSPNTRAAYRTDLDNFVRWCTRAGVDPLATSAQDLAEYRASCEQLGSGQALLARRFAAIGSFLRYCAAHGTPGAADAYATLARPLTSAVSNTSTLSSHEASLLLRAADGLNAKTAFVVRLLMLDGLKIGEAVRADADDLSGRSPRMTLKVERQQRPHAVALHVDTGTAARRYLAGRRTGPLLVGDGPARIDARLTRFGVDYLLKRAVEAAGLTAPISSNTLRRHFVIAAHAGGTALDEIQRRAGHVDQRTTRRYLGTAD